MVETLAIYLFGTFYIVGSLLALGMVIGFGMEKGMYWTHWYWQFWEWKSDEIFEMLRNCVIALIFSWVAVGFFYVGIGDYRKPY